MHVVRSRAAPRAPTGRTTLCCGGCPWSAPARVASGEFFLLGARPGCGTLLDTELAAGDDPHTHDRVNRWPEA